MNSQLWHRPAVIADNHFVNKSLSCWSYNVAVGCAHACRFCYVPDVSTIKLGPKLAEMGVKDPDAEWGDYVMVRPFDSGAFLASLRRAEARTDLNADGNRAVMFSTTTDPYQALPQRAGGQALEESVRMALALILKNSTLNVRILTRSPMAERDFDLMLAFGHRLLFGMSLPTVDNRLARVYEPRAPAPRQRLATLHAAKAAGLHVYVAVAPTYPEMRGADLRAVMEAVAELDPVTIFHEPINIRAENVARIQTHARNVGVTLRDDVWASKKAWADYQVEQLTMVEMLAKSMGLGGRLHPWPDKEIVRHRPDMADWCANYWGRISAWPAG